MIGIRQAGRYGCAAAPGDLIRERQSGRRASRFKRKINSAAGCLFHAGSHISALAANTSVAPSCCAKSNFFLFRSTTTMRRAPASNGTQDTTQTDAARADDRDVLPTGTLAVFKTAPTPVIIAQPNKAAVSNSNRRSLSPTRTRNHRGLGESGNAQMMIHRLPSSANAVRRSKAFPPDWLRRQAHIRPDGLRGSARSARNSGQKRRPLYLRRSDRHAFAGLDHFAGRFVSQDHGHHRGRLPSNTLKSEWHKLAARRRTKTSPGPGSSNSHSSMPQRLPYLT